MNLPCFSRKAWVGCVVVWAQAVLSLLSAAEPVDRPNFIFVLCDDLGFNDVGAYTYPDVTNYYPNAGPAPSFPEPQNIPGPNEARTLTPRLDAMASEGMRFTSFYSCANVCSPARASLMTGSYGQRLGILGALFPNSSTGLNTTEITLPEILKTRGYATSMVGKWHLGYMPLGRRSTQFLPTRQGFDEFQGIGYSGDMFGTPIFLLENETPSVYLGENFGNIGDGLHTLIWRATERSLDFIERSQDEPFFLFVSHAMPHVPVHPSRTTFANADGSTWPMFQGSSGVSYYYDVVKEIDHSMGRIYDKLDALGLDDNTLVIFTSDNGPWSKRWSQNLTDISTGSAYPLRGSKVTSYEGGSRVPCIARWPGKIPVNVVNDDICGLNDILPTLSKLAGAEPPTDRVLDGRDIWPILAQEPNAVSPHDAMYFYSAATLDGIRDGSWKFREVGSPELYNLTADIQERTNLASSEANMVADMRARMAAFDADLLAHSRPIGRYSNQEIVIDSNRFSVVEGGTVSFQVKLIEDPRATIEVYAQNMFGDASVQPGSVLPMVFDSSNWATWQTMSIIAGHDADGEDGGAMVRLSSPSFQPVREVFLAVEDDDLMPEIDLELVWPKTDLVRLTDTNAWLYLAASMNIGTSVPPNSVTTTWSVVSGMTNAVFMDETALETGVRFLVESNCTVRITASVDCMADVVREFDVEFVAGVTSPPAATLVYDADLNSATNTLWENQTLVMGRDWALSASPFVGDPAPHLVGIDASYQFSGQAVPSGATSLHLDAYSMSNASVEIWCKPTDVNQPDPQVLWETGGDIGSSLTRVGATLRFAVDDAGPDFAQGELIQGTLVAAPNHNGFIHIVGVIDLAGDVSRLFINGVEASSGDLSTVTDWAGASYSGLGTIADVVGNETTELGHLGGNDLLPGDPVGTFAGQIAKVKLYNRALTAAEVLRAFDAVSQMNVAPKVDAGVDQAVAFSTGANMQGIASDFDVLSTLWSASEAQQAPTFADEQVLVTSVDFRLPGRYLLRLDASDQHARVFDEVEILVAALTFDEWVADQSFTIGDEGASENPDNDPWINIWEWAVDGNPLVSDPIPVTGMPAIAETGGVLRVTFAFDKPRDREPVIKLQHTEDLDAVWQDVPASEPTITPFSATHERWALQYDVPSTEPAGFYRVVIER